jgi:hypothetical protein
MSRAGIPRKGRIYETKTQKNNCPGSEADLEAAERNECIKEEVGSEPK